jgi:cytochrome c oxidase subunit 4
MKAHGDIGYGGYVGVWGALVVLATTTLLTSSVAQGVWAVVAALAFATVKAFLVVWFFMHMSSEGLASRFSFLVAVLFVVLLVGFTLGDVMLRPEMDLHVPLSR